MGKQKVSQSISDLERAKLRSLYAAFQNNLGSRVVVMLIRRIKSKGKYHEFVR